MPFNFACDRIIKIKMGVDRCWCASWSSKPVIAVNSRLGGFDSHILPPESDRSLFIRDRFLNRKKVTAMNHQYQLTAMTAKGG